MDLLVFSVWVLPPAFILLLVYGLNWMICGEDPKGSVWNGLVACALIWIGLFFVVSK